MYQSKIIHLLQRFTAKELKSFHLFAKAAFFNKNEEVVRLLSYLIPLHPFSTPTGLSKVLVFENLYPQLPYQDKQIRYMMSHLLKLAERFLLVQKTVLGETEASLQLLDEFVSRNLDKHYTQLKNKLTVETNKNSIINIRSFEIEMRIADLENKHFTKQHHRLFNNKMQQGSDALNHYFALKKLKYACAMLDRQALLTGDYQLGLPENWIAWIKENHYWNKKIIEIYAGVFMALKHEDNLIYFDKLNTLLLTSTVGISKEDLKELFLYAINYCARKIRKGENKYIEIALNLYLKGIKEEVLLDNTYLSPWTFGNIVKLALRLEKYDWIEGFMEEHKYRLPPDFQSNALQYNLAQLYCFKKDFSTALSFLFKVEFSDPSYHLGSRIMLSKIYFELGEEDALLSLMNSFTIYLKRNKKISDAIRNTCLNFCNLLFLIIRGKTDGLEEKIKNTTLLADREWLLEKVINE